MIRHWSIIWRAVSVGGAYLIMRAPLDVALMHAARDHDLSVAILMSHLIGTALLVVLVYLVLYYKVHTLVRPWKCPVCEGHGYHYYIPAVPEVTDMHKTMEPCHACCGKGYIWESGPKV